MMGKKMSFVPLLFAVGLLIAQSTPDQSSSANKAPTKNSKGDLTVQGCVARATGYYILMQTDPDNSYNLEEGNRKIKVGPHLGEQVGVTGWESPALSTSSSSSYRVPASAVTLMVTSIRTIGKRCTAGEVSASSFAAPVSLAQLEVSSTPSNADIEIDGDFVGQTTSVVGVEAGQHQLVVKKSGYKAWEKMLKVTSGQIRVHAELQAESK